jgi:recombination protein RecR
VKHYKIEPFENLVDAFNALPGIGKKSAIRLAYHIAMVDGFSGVKLAHAIEDGVNAIHKCVNCHNMSEDELCIICADEGRDRTQLCVVQSAKDILSFEESRQSEGV